VSTALRTRLADLRALWSPRVLALGSTLVLLFSFLSVLYGIVDVAGGDPLWLVGLTGLALLAATALARLVRVVVAVGAAVLVLGVGMGLYVVSLPYDPQLGAMIDSNVELLTGQSLLQIKQATVWALSVAPTPVFVTWYLALRRWYAGAALAGGLTLGYFVLTTDAGTTVTLLGVIAGAAAVGFGDLDHRDTTPGAVESVAVVLALMILAPAVVTVAPAGATSPVSLDDGDGTTVEASLLSADAQFDVVGSIELSPKVRFTVDSPRPRYWRVGGYDRYTGDGWVRSGGTSDDPGSLDSPPGPTTRLRQQFTAESATSAMPAAWRPVGLSGGVSDRARFTADGGLQLSQPLAVGQRYNVTSAVLQPSPEALATAGTDYPAALERQYTQLPGSTADRVGERTARLTQRAENPYETALAIEQWLENNREYSLEVDRPDGNVAEAFLFEMEAGYCTYYATTMATMLRTQGIPARTVVGYTPGQQVAEDRWVVRGYNSHAWVEVYFPDTGWVRFDPTPAQPRQDAEQARLAQARTSGVPGVDTTDSVGQQPQTPTEARTPIPTTPPADGPTDTATPTVTEAPTGPGGGTDGFELPDLPSREQLALGAVVLAGAVAGLRRTGLSRRFASWLSVRRGRRGDPAADVERAFARLEYLLERRHRERREGETVRAYLDAVGASERARRVAAIRERAEYAGEVSPEDAETAFRLVREFARETGATAAARSR
jgi:transglutaminase-like putative cysteine protease